MGYPVLRPRMLDAIPQVSKMWSLMVFVYQMLLNILLHIFEWHLSFQIFSNHIPPYPCFFKFHAHFNTFFQMVSKPIWKPLGEVSSVPASRWKQLSLQSAAKELHAATPGKMRCSRFAIVHHQGQPKTCFFHEMNRNGFVWKYCIPKFHGFRFPIKKTKKQETLGGTHHFKTYPNGDHPLSNRNIPFDLAEVFLAWSWYAALGRVVNFEMYHLRSLGRVANLKNEGCQNGGTGFDFRLSWYVAHAVVCSSGGVGGCINGPDGYFIYVTEHVAVVNMLHMPSYIHQGGWEGVLTSTSLTAQNKLPLSNFVNMLHMPSYIHQGCGVY